MSEKDYSLLRPLDVEAAKRGEAILWGGQFTPATYVARSNDGKTNIVEVPTMHGGLLSKVCYAPDDYLRMAPIEWVEGKPVYKDDVLYYRLSGHKFHVKKKPETDGFLVGLHEFGRPHGFGLQSRVEHLSVLTWDQPRPKQDDGWITWNGGECPVPEGTLVDVRYRFGHEKRPYKAENYRWMHYGAVHDIVAYRVVEQPKPTPKPVKRWVNVYPGKYAGAIYRSRAEADDYAAEGRIDCIEIELPPLAEVAK